MQPRYPLREAIVPGAGKALIWIVGGRIFGSEAGPEATISKRRYKG
jgi:hypothetical protein